MTDGTHEENRPAVSVVLPTRNRWAELTRFGLRAARSQNEVDHEIIIVDDHSDEAVVLPPTLQDARTVLVRLPEHRGVAAARNEGIRRARGRWIALLDDDDLWAPSKLAMTVNAAEATGADFAYSGVLVLDNSLRPTRLVPPTPESELLSTVSTTNGIHATASNLVVRRSALEDIGLFDERFSTAADWELLYRLASAHGGVAVHEPLVAYTASGWVTNAENLHRADLRRLEQKHPCITVDWHAFEALVARSLHNAGLRRQAARRYLKLSLSARDPKKLVRAGSVLFAPTTVERIRQRSLPHRPAWLSSYRAPAPLRPR